MDTVTLDVAEPVYEELPELRELLWEEMDQIGGAMCDPGIIDIEK